MLRQPLTAGLLIAFGAAMITGSLYALEPIGGSAPDCSLEGDAIAAAALAKGRQQVLDCVRSIGGDAARAAEECDY